MATVQDRLLLSLVTVGKRRFRELHPDVDHTASTWQVGIKAKCQHSLQYALLPAQHTDTFGCRIGRATFHECIRSSLTKQIKRKGNVVSPSPSSPGTIPRSERGENTLIYSLKVRSPESILRTEGHIYSLLRSSPCSVATMDHFWGEADLGRRCSHSLQAVVARLHPALGGSGWILKDERGTELIRGESDASGSDGSYLLLCCVLKERARGY